MKATQLSDQVTHYIQHIDGWESLISDDIADVLDKIARNEPLSRSDLGTEATPTEVAAIWSVKNKIDIQPTYVRQVKRAGRIEPSREWGRGPSYRCLYKVREVVDIKVGHDRGRPAKKAKMAA
jgi:hypothetical protein